MSRDMERGATAQQLSLASIHDLRLRSGATRSVLRPFLPGDVAGYVKDGTLRRSIVESVLGLSGDDVEQEIARVLDPLRARHRDPEAVLAGLGGGRDLLLP